MSRYNDVISCPPVYLHLDYPNKMEGMLRVYVRTISLLTLVLSTFAISYLQEGNSQVENWTRYDDPGKKFNFLHPPNWKVNTRHVDASGFTEVTLSSPNSTRMKVLVTYTPKDSLLDSPTGVAVVPSRALANLEQQMGEEYLFFNSTGKFPHKYSIQGYPSASDLIDFEKVQGQPGKMLVVLAEVPDRNPFLSKVTDQDTLVVVYSESKRSFYKSLPNATQIIRSISIN